ncbi:ferredoxin [Arcticibacter sp. MXS-1]|uniref:ferredoxin n=1 Tax=Arcticibacter sp. MXS-1 TaxID=3341726 RepID=UPI0035A9A6E2
MVRITQQRAKCIGCNACVEAASYRWRISRRDGKCTLIQGVEKRGFYTVVVGDDEYEENRSAALHCPVNIIKVEQIK